MTVVGAAYVEIRPQTTRLHREAEGAIRRALAGVTGSIDVNPDLSGFRQRVQAEARRATAGIEAEIEVGADTDGLRREVSRAAAVAASGVTSTISADVDTGGLRREVARAATAAGAGQEVEVGLDLESGAMGELRREVSRAVGGAGAGQSVNVNISTSGGDDGIRRLGDDIKSLDERAMGLGGTLALVFSPAITMSAGALAAAVGAIASAAVQATSALGPLVGLIPALAVGVSAVGQAAGVVSAAFSGIKDTLKAYISAEEQAATAVDTSAKRAASAARQRLAAAEGVEDAQRALADAHRSAAEGVVAAEGRIADAQRSLANAQREAAEAVEAAQQRVVDAHARVAEASRDAAEANENAAQRVADAQRRVDDAHREATESVVDAAERVTDAQIVLQDAQRDAERVAVDSAERIAKAERDLAEAYEDAAQRSADALERVEDAEENLADAQDRAREAQEALTDARRDATEELEDMALAVRGAFLSEESARLRVAEARDRLNRGGFESDLERRRAVLSLQDAEHDLAVAIERRGDVEERNRELQRQGVEGSDQVTAANRRLRDATDGVADADERLAEAQATVARTAEESAERIADSQRQVARAQESQARAQEDSSRRVAEAHAQVAYAQRDLVRANEDASRRIADAQRSLNEAQRDQLRTQEEGNRRIAEAHKAVAEAQARVVRAEEDGARRIGDAQRGVGEAQAGLVRAQEEGARRVENAQRNVARAVRRAAEVFEEEADSGTAAARKFAYAMEQLSPAGQSFVRTLLDVRQDLQGLRDVAAEAMFPGLERGLRTVRPLIGDFSPIVRDTGLVLGGLAERAGEVAASPFFRSTFTAIGQANVGIIAQLGDAVLDAAPGLAALVRESIPLTQHLANVAGNALRAAGHFLELEAASGGLQRFFTRTRESFDLVVSIGGDLVRTLIGVGRAGHESGMQLLSGLGRALDELADKVNSARGQANLRGFFADLQPLQIELGRLAGAIGESFAEITQAVGPRLAPVIAQIRTEFLPVLTELFSNFDPALMGSIVGLLGSIAGALGGLAEGAPALKFLVDTARGVIEFIDFLLSEIPVLSPLIASLFAAISGLGAAFGAIKLGRLISEHAGFHAGLKVITDTLPLTTAQVGSFQGVVGRVGSVLGGAAGLAGLLYAAKAAFDAFAPSVEKSVRAVASAENPFRAIQDEMRRLNEPGFWDQFWTTGKRAVTDFSGFLGDVFKPGNQAVDELRTKFEDLFRGVAQGSPVAAQRIIDDMRAMGADTSRLQGILDELKVKHEQAGQAAFDQGQKMDGLQQALQRGRDAVQEFNDKLNVLLGVHVSESQALITFHQNLDTLKTKLEENGTTLDLTTQKGRDNKGAIDNMVTGIGSHITALLNEGATMDEIRGAFDRHIEDFRRTLREAGFTEEQIHALIEEYGLVPENVRTLLGVDGLADYEWAMQRARLEAQGVWDIIQHAAGRVIALNPFTRESGGTLEPDKGFVTNRPVFLVGEGNPTYPEYVVPTDPKYRGRALNLFNQLGSQIQAFQAGGVIGRGERLQLHNEYRIDAAELGRRLAAEFGRLTDEIHRLIPAESGGGYGFQALIDFLVSKGVEHGVSSTVRPGARTASGHLSLHAVGLAADFVGRNMRAIFDTFAQIAPSLQELFYDPAGRSVKRGQWGNFTVGGHGDHVHAATWAGPHEGPGIPGAIMPGGGAGGGPESWIREALRITGSPASWYDGIFRRMMQESGGRNIPQGIIDINTRKGTPAFGPMQVIEPTFRRYALPGYENWKDPLHNTIAAIRYIADRYGSPYNLPRGGYARGGIVPANLHVGEMVLPKDLSDFVRRAAAVAAVFPAGLEDSVRRAFDKATVFTHTTSQPAGPALTPIPAPSAAPPARGDASGPITIEMHAHLEVGSISGGADPAELSRFLHREMVPAFKEAVHSMIRSGEFDDAMSWNALARS